MQCTQKEYLLQCTQRAFLLQHTAYTKSISATMSLKFFLRFNLSTVGHGRHALSLPDNLEAAGVLATLQTVPADAGEWDLPHEQQLSTSHPALGPPTVSKGVHLLDKGNQ